MLAFLPSDRRNIELVSKQGRGGEGRDGMDSRNCNPKGE